MSQKKVEQLAQVCLVLVGVDQLVVVDAKARRVDCAVLEASRQRVGTVAENVLIVERVVLVERLARRACRCRPCRTRPPTPRPLSRRWRRTAARRRSASRREVVAILLARQISETTY